MKKTLAIAASLVPVLVGAAVVPDVWLPIVSSKDGDTTWEAKQGSGEIVVTEKDGEAHFIAIQRSRTAGKDSYGWAHVAMKSCARGFGTLSVFSLQGVPLYSSVFVLKGPNVADILASNYCAAAAIVQARAV